MGAMHMSMCNFFARGSPNINYFERKTQGFTGHRVVAVQQHLITFDFQDSKYMRLAVVATAFQLAAHLHPRGELRFGNGLHQRFVTQAKGIFGREFNDSLISDLLPLQCCLDLGKSVAIASLLSSRTLPAGSDIL